MSVNREDRMSGWELFKRDMRICRDNPIAVFYGLLVSFAIACIITSFR